MKHRPRRLFPKTLALLFTLSFCLSGVAQALTVEQFRSLLQAHYIDQIGDSVLQQNTVSDTIAALGDPYTLYMDAKQYQSFLASMQDTPLVGIGISATLTEQGLLLTSIYPQSPSAEAGFLVGDIITVIDGKAVAGQPIEAALGWMSGEAGTHISIELLHANGSHETYSLTRRSILIPSTQWTQTGQVGLILCNTFGADTLRHFTEAMTAYPDSSAWLIDLRSNPGGDIYATAETLGLFFGDKDLFYLRNNAGQYQRYTASQQASVKSPLLLLSSQWTASAAELFSGVVRDENAGLIIGTRTFGKGVAQVLLDSTQYPDYFSTGDAAKITAYRYYTASGTTADQIGILPHLLVDTQQADEVALLLSAQAPDQDNGNTLRIDFADWLWYVDLPTARLQRSDFLLLLQALPPSATLACGSGAGKWSPCTVEELVAAQGLTELYQPRRFTDADNSPFETAIDTLSTYDLIFGYEDGLFHPEDSMTRAEFCALLVQALNLRPRTQITFSDVPEDAWFATSVQAICSAGLMEGIGHAEFQPNGTVTHEQMITVLSRLSDSLNLFLHESMPKDGLPEANHVPNTYSSWAQPWVWLLSESQKDLKGQSINLLYAPVAQIAPQEVATRGEAASLLYRVLSYLKVLPS